MSIKGTKAKARKTGSPDHRAALPIEDDERHAVEVDDYISRNRDTLNTSIQRSRREVAEGKVSSKSIETIIAEGHRRHSRGS
jgi:hypothetical protein